MAVVTLEPKIAIREVHGEANGQTLSRVLREIEEQQAILLAAWESIHG